MERCSSWCSSHPLTWGQAAPWPCSRCWLPPRVWLMLCHLCHSGFGPSLGSNLGGSVHHKVLCLTKEIFKRFLGQEHVVMGVRWFPVLASPSEHPPSQSGCSERPSSDRSCLCCSTILCFLMEQASTLLRTGWLWRNKMLVYCIQL